MPGEGSTTNIYHTLMEIQRELGALKGKFESWDGVPDQLGDLERKVGILVEAKQQRDKHFFAIWGTVIAIAGAQLVQWLGLKKGG